MGTTGTKTENVRYQVVQQLFLNGYKRITLNWKEQKEKNHPKLKRKIFEINVLHKTLSTISVHCVEMLLFKTWYLSNLLHQHIFQNVKRKHMNCQSFSLYNMAFSSYNWNIPIVIFLCSLCILALAYMAEYS